MGDLSRHLPLPRELAALLEKDAETWGKLIRDKNIKPE
jgi:hypothetical protein